MLFEASGRAEAAPSATPARISLMAERDPFDEAPDSPRDESPEWSNRRASEQATRAAMARRVSGRRRFVDPTTCERDYSEAEMEFMLAMNDYKQRSGRMFPTWSEVLEVLRSLGYEKPSQEGLMD